MNELPRTQALRCFITVAREGTVSRAATLAEPDPAGRQPAAEGAGGKHRPAAFQPHAGRLHPDRGGRRPAAAGAQGGIRLHRFQDDGGFAARTRSAKRCASAPSSIPNSSGSGPFVRSLATSSQKTEVFLRYGMSDDVLAQIGKGELDVGYYIDATPPQSLLHPDLLRTHDRRRQIPARAADELRLPRDRASEMGDKVMGKDWADLARLPWLATPPAFGASAAARRIFRPLGPMPKRVALPTRKRP